MGLSVPKRSIEMPKRQVRMDMDEARNICAYLSDHRSCLKADLDFDDPGPILLELEEIERLMERLYTQPGFPADFREVWEKEIARDVAERAPGGIERRPNDP